MKTVSVSALKARLSEYLRLVRRGGEVWVTDRGVAVARLVPIHGVPTRKRDDQRVERLVRAGVLSPADREGDARRVVERPPLGLPNARVSEALQQERDNRL